MKEQQQEPLPDLIPCAEYWRDRPGLAAPAVSETCGRGLFALVPIVWGTLIDRAWTVEITPDQCLVLDTLQPVGDMYFAHPENDKAGLMAFGLAPLCNHSDDPNADIIWNKVPGLGWVGDLVARRNIDETQEITHRYKCELWFAPKRTGAVP